MRNRIVLLVALVVSTCIGAFAQAPLKIGYTNVNYIISLLPEVKQAESELLLHEKQLKTQMESKVADYQKKVQEYQKGESSGLMSDVVKDDKLKELAALEKSIREFEEVASQSIEDKKLKLLEPIYAKVQKSIEKVAAANGYTYVFDDGGSAIILYARNKEDNISDLVLKDLGVTPPAEKPATNTNTTAPLNKTTTPTTPR